LEREVSKWIELYRVFRLYKRRNPSSLAFKRAWHIAINGSPF
jgi:hypothetical protein